VKSRGEPGWLGAEEERKAGVNNSLAPSVSNAIAQNYTYGAKKTEKRSRWATLGRGACRRVFRCRAIGDRQNG
jgi:hypothetical protein